MLELTTKIYKTKSGADIREDTELCGKPTLTGEQCKECATRLYIRFNDPSKKLIRTYCFVCIHQKKDIGDKVYWNTEMIVSLTDKINSGKTFKIIHDELEKEFPIYPDGSKVSWCWTAKIETRPGKGRYKEFDCSAKKKYEDMKLKSCGEVWDKNILRNDAKKTCTSNKNFTGLRQKLIGEQPDISICKLCGHEMYWHQRGQCIECKGLCNGND